MLDAGKNYEDYNGETLSAFSKNGAKTSRGIGRAFCPANKSYKERRRCQKNREKENSFMLIFYAEKPASISIRTLLAINPGSATCKHGRIITMSGNVAD